MDPLRRGELAPPPRTLVDIFRATVEQAADEPAVDAGTGVLTYAELAEAADELAVELGAHGIGTGDKVGVRVNSGTTDLYVAILGILLAGAAYVPVDVDDPDERARLVFDEADVAAIVGNDQTVVMRREGPPRDPEEPGLGDDAWVIFTSGSTGTPKGVAVSHRSAAAFVDAESRMFLQAEPLGVGDRVMAGLSVAFDASCEEMWLAWRYGACLVPAPRALVKSGIDVGPVAGRERRHRGLDRADPGRAVAAGVAGRRPAADHGRRGVPARAGRAAGRPRSRGLEHLRPDRGHCGRLRRPADRRGADPDRAAAGRLGPRRGRRGRAARCPRARTGELIIGGVGLARYLDPAKDAEKYAAMPTLGWDRAYRSGDLVVNDPAGLLFGGRSRTTRSSWAAGGSSSERSTPHCSRSLASSARRLRSGVPAPATSCSSGTSPTDGAVRPAPRPWSCCGTRCRPRWCRGSRWSTCCPPARRARSTATRCPGRCPPAVRNRRRRADCTARWPGSPSSGSSVLGADVADPGRRLLRPRRRQPHRGAAGLPAARPVPRGRGRRHLRAPHASARSRPTSTSCRSPARPRTGPSRRRRSRHRPAQVVATLLLRALAGPYWLVWVGIGSRLLADVLGWTLLPQPAWWLLALGWLVFVTPPGRMLLAAAARVSCFGTSSRATTRGAARCTSGSGWPSARSTSSAPPGWPGRRT